MYNVLLPDTLRYIFTEVPQYPAVKNRIWNHGRITRWLEMAGYWGNQLYNHAYSILHYLALILAGYWGGQLSKQPDRWIMLFDDLMIWYPADRLCIGVLYINKKCWATFVKIAPDTPPTYSTSTYFSCT